MKNPLQLLLKISYEQTASSAKCSDGSVDVLTSSVYSLKFCSSEGWKLGKGGENEDAFRDRAYHPAPVSCQYSQTQPVDSDCTWKPFLQIVWTMGSAWMWHLFTLFLKRVCQFAGVISFI